MSLNDSKGTEFSGDLAVHIIRDVAKEFLALYSPMHSSNPRIEWCMSRKTDLLGASNFEGRLAPLALWLYGLVAREACATVAWISAGML